MVETLEYIVYADYKYLPTSVLIKVIAYGSTNTASTALQALQLYSSTPKAFEVVEPMQNSLQQWLPH
jgi:hypothetical protein